MALRNQPFIKFFPKDWMADEKLKECNAESHGIYINLMCLMHQSGEYGVILLKQKYKQNGKQIFNFASQLTKQLPFSVEEIERGLAELIYEGVLQLDDDRLSQKRMVKDANLSDTRAYAGSVGGKSKGKGDNFALAKTQAKHQAKGQANSQAKTQANTEYEYVYVSENENVSENSKKKNGNSSSRAREEKSELEKAIDDFIDMRKKIKKPATERAMNTIRKKLQEMAPDDEPTQILILEQSIECCWQTVYPLKEKHGNGQRSTNNKSFIGLVSNNDNS